MRRLQIKGTSEDLKKFIFKRHLLYALVYLILLIRVIFDFNGQDIFFDKYSFLNQAFTCFLNSAGIWLALICLFEPFVWYEFKKSLFCVKITHKNAFNQDSLETFLNSAMNIEFVYLILVGVNSHLDQRNMLKGNQKTQSKVKV